MRIPAVGLIIAVALTSAACSSSRHDAAEKYFLVTTNVKLPYWQAANSGLVRAAKQAGVMGYLVKPLRPAELTPAIELVITRFHDCSALRAENSMLKENLEARKFIERAKGLLMRQKNLSEEEAYTLLKRTSMNVRKPMAEIAQAIISAGGPFDLEKR